MPYFEHAKEITNAQAFGVSVPSWSVICILFEGLERFGHPIRNRWRQSDSLSFVLKHDACSMNWPQSGREIFMSRIWSIGFVFASMTGAFATSGFAQSNGCYCPCYNSAVGSAPVAMQVQSYQPAAMLPTQVASGMVMSQPSVVYAAPQAQSSYRRFSYQPSAASNRSGLHKEAWEYSKADPRRQQH